MEASPNIAIGWPSAWSSGTGMLATVSQNYNQRNIIPWESWFLFVNWEEQFKGNIAECRYD